MSGGRGEAGAQAGETFVVIVPPSPGPLVRPDAARTGRRNRDGLDDLIDELLPDTEESPGLTDAALIAGGGALVGWSVLGSPPVAATVTGMVVVGLGCILPARAGWRRVTGRRRSRRRAALLAGGVPLHVDDPTLARLVAAYESLDGLPVTTEAARAAAHGAVLEVASLLMGRRPASDAERRYLLARTVAVEELVRALEEIVPAASGRGRPSEEPVAIAPHLVVEAREELDALGGVSALSRLDDVTADVRAHGRRR